MLFLCLSKKESSMTSRVGNLKLSSAPTVFSENQSSSESDSVDDAEFVVFIFKSWKVNEWTIEYAHYSCNLCTCCTLYLTVFVCLFVIS